MADTASRTWRNWGGNQRCAPVEIARPRSAEDLMEVVKSAAKEGLRVKAVGSGHSFTDVACTHGVQVRLDEYARLLRYDPDASTVTVEAGMTLAALAGELARRGLALANLGDIGYQTVAGAISTGTHGTGDGLGPPQAEQPHRRARLPRPRMAVPARQGPLRERCLRSGHAARTAPPAVDAPTGPHRSRLGADRVRRPERQGLHDPPVGPFLRDGVRHPTSGGGRRGGAGAPLRGGERSLRRLPGRGPLRRGRRHPALD